MKLLIVVVVITSAFYSQLYEKTKLLSGSQK